MTIGTSVFILWDVGQTEKSFDRKSGRSLLKKWFSNTLAGPIRKDWERRAYRALAPASGFHDTVHPTYAIQWPPVYSELDNPHNTSRLSFYLVLSIGGEDPS